MSAITIIGTGNMARTIGGLAMAHWLEGMGLVTVGLAGNGVDHRNFALGVDEVTG